jgi:hypothetical protein
MYKLACLHNLEPLQARTLVRRRSRNQPGLESL